MEEQHPTCVDCRKRFPTKRDFDKHHHPTCHICDKVVLTEKALDKHLKIHPKCQRCGAIFLNETQLKIHAIHSHERLEPERRRERSRSPHDRNDNEMFDNLDSDSTMDLLSIDQESDASTLIANKDVVPLEDGELSVDSDASMLSDDKDIVPCLLYTSDAADE